MKAPDAIAVNIKVALMYRYFHRSLLFGHKKTTHF
jgi:hypothetical protein